MANRFCQKTILGRLELEILGGGPPQRSPKGDDEKSLARQKKRARQKSKKYKPCFDSLERRGIVDLGAVATGDGVQLVLKRRVMTNKLLLDTICLRKIIITRPADHPQT